MSLGLDVLARLSPYERAVNRLNDLPRGLDRIFTEALEDMRAQRDTARAERDEAVDVLKRRQFSAMDDKCPECAGWNASPNGETPLVHTKDCALAAVLAKSGRR